MFAAIGGALSAVKAGSAEPNAYGDILLTAITAVLIGGIAVRGGRGGASNILIGVLILAALDSGISIHGYQSYISDVITAALLLIVVVVEFLLEGTSGSGALAVAIRYFRSKSSVHANG
jgi:ribose/xylose/arabinose/galactoside ABC-type transport system permease subunit